MRRRATSCWRRAAPSSRSSSGARVGLEDVALESDLDNQTSLVLGKYLSPRLYVSYGISFTEQLNTLKLRYTLERQVDDQDRGGRGARRGPRVHDREVAAMQYGRANRAGEMSTELMRACVLEFCWSFLF